jgi:NADH-quinone oxidoreductase subunit C
MSERKEPLAALLKQRFGDKLAALVEAHGQVAIEVAPEHWQEVARALRDEREFGFEQAIDLCGLDFLGYGSAEWDTEDVSNEGFSRGVEGEGPGRFDWAGRPVAASRPRRFAVAVQLLSISRNRRLRLVGYCADGELPTIPTLTEIWPGLNWFEREAFDLYGILFEGHADLRRLLTDYGFVGHPFRKDFPLIGNVECRYDEVKGRVVYEPVSIEPRVGVPKVVRHDSRYQQGQAEAAAQGGK